MYGNEFATSFSANSLSSIEQQRDLKRKLKRYFKNQIIVDLGAGKNIRGLQIATALDAKGYIGVESNWPKQLHDIIKRKEETLKIPVAVVPEDMLSFLQRLPDKSVGVMAHGITWEILHSQDYTDKVDNEIMRVLAKNSAFFGDSHSILLQKFNSILDRRHLVPRKRE